MTVIPNWADCQSIQPQNNSKNHFREREGLGDNFLVMHSGNMGLTQRLETLVEATRSAFWPSNARLLLVGDGAARLPLQRKVENDQCGRVRFLPYQPRRELATSLTAADLHVVSMHENITGCLCPSKLYGILAAGRPLLAVAAEATDLCKTVTKHELGWCCRPGDSDGIAEAVAFAANNSAALAAAGENARQLACKEFDRPVVLEQFRNLLLSVLSERPGFVEANRRDNLAPLQAIS